MIVSGQTQVDVVDMHHGRVDDWLEHHPGQQPRDLLTRFVDRGVGAFFFKASEGRSRDPRFRELVETAHDVGVAKIGAYHVNLRGDAGLSRVDAEIDNFVAQIDGLPVGVWMVDWETWEKQLPDGSWVARDPDDPKTGGTIEQTVKLVTALDQARPTKVFLYAGLPMIPRHVNDTRLRSFPLVYPDYRNSSGDDPVGAAAKGGIVDAAPRVVMHQWGGSDGMLGFDSNRVIDQARFEAAFGDPAGLGGTDLPHGKFGLFPLNPAKPSIRRGDEGELVLYVQSVIFFKAGGDIELNSRFDAQTEKRVKDMQQVFARPETGEVDHDTWGVVDFLTGT